MKIVSMQQVHGNTVVLVGRNDAGKTVPECDALITSDPTVTLCVRVADCLPVSVIDKKGRGIGLIHAGWRGLEKKIIVKSIRMMSQEFGTNNEELEIAIGPHICADHYEVKDDVSEKFTNYPKAIIKKDGKEFLNLAKVAKLQLLSLGISKENIFIDSRCTFEDLSLHSYRRNKTANRNMVTLSSRRE
jgi:hypothetical protein